MTHEQKVINFFANSDRKTISLKDAVNMGLICLSQTIGRLERKGYKFLHFKVKGKHYSAYEYKGWSNERK